MKKVCVVTASRAEYGLLKSVIKKLKSHSEVVTEIVVTGSHLSGEFGNTYQEIIQDGFVIDKKIECLLNSDTPQGVSKSMGLMLIGFGEYFSESRPDLLLVLGDRYELLAICGSAIHFNIPIGHIHGGETTEGAVDDMIRHCISKLSSIHFTSTVDYQQRVIQMGEDPKRVFNVGALGVENVLHTSLLSKEELENSLGVKWRKPYAVVTFHPVTTQPGQARSQILELLGALDSMTDMEFLLTKSNADVEGRIINQIIEDYTKDREHIKVFSSLGVVRYLSAIKYSQMVIGNSSSGILEVPSFGIATVNIGNRQKGRIQADSVLNCSPKKEEIIKAIQEVQSEAFRTKIKSIINPYGDGDTSNKIVNEILKYLSTNEVNNIKRFYDIEFCL